MLNRKTQYGFMVLGAILCLCGAILALKLREGNPAVAQTDPPAPPPSAALPDAPPPKPTPEAAPPAPKPDDLAPPLPAPPAPLPEPTKAEPPGPLPPPSPDAVKNQQPDDAKREVTIPDLPSPPPPTPPLGQLPPKWDRPTTDAATPHAPPGANAPGSPTGVVLPPAVVQASQVGEPPLAGMGPIQTYHVRGAGETMRDIARHTLGAGERCTEVYKLNPGLHPEDTLEAGTVVHLPPDACLPVEEVEGIKPLPAMRPTTAPARPKTVLALTGTYPCNLDDKRTLTLPRAVRDQLGDAEMVLASPGPDQCLWLTDPAHQERLAERLEHSPAREVDVRVFKRLYYAQTEKVSIGADGRITLSDRLAQFAGLSQEVVLVGIDDHFEIWDAARWKQYTQTKSAVGAE